MCVCRDLHQVHSVQLETGHGVSGASGRNDALPLQCY
jgi:hypothetical protein